VRSRRATSLLDHLFYALSDPTRRDILAMLARAPANLTQLTNCSRLSFAAVAKHIKMLERGKLIRRRTETADRRAIWFELRPQPLDSGIEWLERHRDYWQARLDELEAFVSVHYRGKGQSKGRADGSSRR